MTCMSKANAVTPCKLAMIQSLGWQRDKCWCEELTASSHLKPRDRMPLQGLLVQQPQLPFA